MEVELHTFRIDTPFGAYMINVGVSTEAAPDRSARRAVAAAIANAEARTTLIQCIADRS